MDEQTTNNKVHMAKIQFGTDENSNQNTVPVEATVTPVTPPASSVPVVYQAPQPPAVATPFFDDENLTLDDIILPRLNIVQRIGDLSAVFRPGDLVLDKTLVLPAPLHIILIGLGPLQYAEKVEGGTGGLLCRNLQQVAEVGGTIDYQTAKTMNKTLFQLMRTGLIAIEKPESVDAGLHFTQEWNGHLFCVALWSMKGSAYTHAVKAVFNTQRKLGLTRKGHITQSWNLEVNPAFKFKNGNIAAVPMVKPADPVPEALQLFLKDLIFGAPSAA